MRRWSAPVSAASPGSGRDNVARQRLGVALALLHEGRKLVFVEGPESADASGAGKLASERHALSGPLRDAKDSGCGS